MLDRIERRGIQARGNEQSAEGIHVTALKHTAQQRRFQQCRAASHERVINHVAGARESLDKKSRQLRLKTGAVRNLVQVVRSTLSGRPKLVYKSRHGQRRPAECGGLRLDLAGSSPEFAELDQLIAERSGATSRRRSLAHEIELKGLGVTSHRESSAR